MKKHITSPISYYTTSEEHSLQWHRADSKAINFALQHTPAYIDSHYRIQPAAIPKLLLSLFKIPHLQTVQQIELSMQEARLLRDFLNRPEIQYYMEREEVPPAEKWSVIDDCRLFIPDLPSKKTSDNLDKCELTGEEATFPPRKPH